ncbi:uncharacterized protein VTP21DRAFT_1115 [Calcarisporiella thermophila]|uniref:uncharacterized protein n=1 Tax=Calcarisporiella thermophila TaxID=911321 RepID=UPI0037432A08
MDCENVSEEVNLPQVGDNNQEGSSNKKNTSTLVIDLKKFKGFPVNDQNDFLTLRTRPEFVYFDRTQYLSTLEDIFTQDVLLFLRPRRFGKSLTLSMLAYFHGLEHKQNYHKLFKGLAIDQDVQAKKINPGQYFILSLDFAGINRSSNLDVAESELEKSMISSIENFTESMPLTWEVNRVHN